MRYTADPKNFISPTLATVKHIARREGLEELTAEELDFVWDVLAKTAGADVRDFDTIEAEADAAVHAFAEAEAFIERYGTDEEWSRDYIIGKFERDFYDQQKERYEVLVNVDLNKIPGYNKPTQAVRLLWLFRAMQRLMVLFYLVVDFAATLNQAFEQMDALNDLQMDMLKAVAEDNDPDEAFMLGLELAVSGIQIEEMLQVCRNLNELAELQSSAELTPDPNGEEMTLRSINELGELGKATQSAFILPPRLRMQRAVSGELDVRDPRTRKQQKQLLFMVVDGSSSMFNGKALSASRAAGIVMNRLEAVMEGHAELYLRFFDGSLREQEFHADSVESARELMRVISDAGQYQGSNTEFERTLKAASRRAEEVLKDRNLRDPEIVFVTDGQATVPELPVLKGNILHVFQVGRRENTTLSELARKSGGMAVYIGQ